MSALEEAQRQGQEHNQDLNRNCKWLQETQENQVETLCLTFSMLLENGEEIDLKPNGRDMDVTEANKEEYLKLLLEHRMLSSIRDQLE